MGDLSQYAAVLILVLGSRRWFVEGVFLMITYCVLCFSMATNGIKNAFDVCTDNFGLDRGEPKYTKCIDYFNAQPAGTYTFEQALIAMFFFAVTRRQIELQ